MAGFANNAFMYPACSPAAPGDAPGNGNAAAYADACRCDGSRGPIAYREAREGPRYGGDVECGGAPRRWARGARARQQPTGAACCGDRDRCGGDDAMDDPCLGLTISIVFCILLLFLIGACAAYPMAYPARYDGAGLGDDRWWCAHCNDRNCAAACWRGK